jgi:methionyl-tRNA formyltransferase
LLRGVVPQYVHGACIPVPQLEATIAGTTTPTYSRKLTKEDGLIDWSKPAQQLEREIRAFITWPKCRTVLAGKEVIITAARVINLQAAPGSIIPDSKRLILGCGQDALEIDRLKPAGKPDMPASAFLAGYKQWL